MTDPFDKLRESVPSGPRPDVRAIKARANRIGDRRRIAVSVGALSVAAVALIGVMFGTTPEPEQAALERRGADPTTADQFVEDSAGAESGNAVTAPVAEPDAARSSGVAGSTDAGSGTSGAGGAPAPVQADSAYKADPLGTPILIVEGRPIGGAEFTLRVCNESKETVTRQFSDSQRFDFVVTAEDSDEKIWRWSDGKSFAQVVGNERWGPKECREWKARWDATTTGNFRAVGTLTTDPPLKSERHSFCTGISC